MYSFDIAKGPINKDKEVNKEKLAQYIKKILKRDDDDSYDNIDVLDVEVTSLELIG